ncbi:TPA: hypothetical protein RZK18_001776 [Campylobacter coli]|uniref:hypothetical protein n=1 Tax=Campylobacter coli TaxID=195 RepID=UPI000576B219|nr:hypothetical protein [Campylobacter coli]HEB7538892.1 hypothetical protein [Campylobacter coli]HEB7570480.1 hypothetical protein [Campylobacter coli]HEB9328952.1 hypothetical protein [Campylobacter coli]HEB9350065.1 hypothetical protein [Campylobacter coli]HEB9356994.1 hypothetical protein [Campylobacter coli]
MTPPSLPDVEKHEDFLQTRKEPYAIYLAINTNIKSYNNICPSEKYFWKFNNMNELDKWYNPKFGIYLGKIVFDKKDNKLIPKYIAAKFENLEEEVKKIKNPLWLANKNPNYIEPKFYDGMSGGYYFESPNNLEYQCKIEKDTQVLSQEQIISYVKELYSKNTIIIKNYIDAINKDYGIKPFVFSDEIYDELGEVGILTKEQANNFKDKSYIKKDPILLAMLDYLAKQNKKDEDYLITFDDEYFYTYLVWSLKDFLLELSYGLFQDETELLFNPAAYMDDTKIYYQNLNEEINKRYEKILLNMGFEGENGYFKDYYDYGFGNNGIFEFSIYDYFAYDEIGVQPIQQSPYVPPKSPFDSPNFVYSDGNYHGDAKLVPSALGKYYFELLYQKEIYIELLRPYYPSIKDLPEGWDNKMLEKANLK